MKQTTFSVFWSFIQNILNGGFASDMKQEYQEAIKRLIAEMQDTAEKSITQSPEWWLDKAQLLATLWVGVTEDLVNYEMAYKKEVVDLLEKGDNVSQAKIKIEAVSENYRAFMYLVKKDKQIAELIKTAKKRVEAERNF